MANAPGPGPWGDPDSPDWIAHRWLHPSAYDAVPDPSKPAGYQAALREKAEEQVAALRQAQAVVRAAAYEIHGAPEWPERVRAAYQRYVRARQEADMATLNSIQPGGPKDPRVLRAVQADHDRDVCLEAFQKVLIDWQYPDAPERVRADYEGYLRARQEADRAALIANRLAGPDGPHGPQAESAYWKAMEADHDEEVADEAFQKVLIEWQYPGAETKDIEPEAGW